MSEHDGMKPGAYTRFDSMTTEELEEMLRQDARIPDGEDMDVDTLMQIAAVIRQRKTPDPNRKTPEEALDIFRNRYLSDDVSEQKAESDSGESRRNSGKVIPMSRWMRRMVSAAAVVAILFVSVAVADAMGYDLWEKLLHWTQDTFYFAGESEPTTPPPSREDDQEYKSLQQVLDYRDITVPLVPKWIPERFALEQINVYDNPIMEKYLGVYICGEEILMVQINRDMEDAPIQYERENGPVEEYESGGMIYYISAESDSTLAVWINGAFECSISGDVNVDEMKRMLDSITE